MSVNENARYTIDRARLARMLAYVASCPDDMLDTAIAFLIQRLSQTRAEGGRELAEATASGGLGAQPPDIISTRVVGDDPILVPRVLKGTVLGDDGLWPPPEDGIERVSSGIVLDPPSGLRVESVADGLQRDWHGEYEHVRPGAELGGDDDDSADDYEDPWSDPDLSDDLG